MWDRNHTSTVIEESFVPGVWSGTGDSDIAATVAWSDKLCVAADVRSGECDADPTQSMCDCQDGEYCPRRNGVVSVVNHNSLITLLVGESFDIEVERSESTAGELTVYINVDEEYSEYPEGLFHEITWPLAITIADGDSAPANTTTIQTSSPPYNASNTDTCHTILLVSRCQRACSVKIIANFTSFVSQVIESVEGGGGIGSVRGWELAVRQLFFPETAEEVGREEESTLVVPSSVQYDVSPIYDHNFYIEFVVHMPDDLAGQTVKVRTACLCQCSGVV